MEVAQLGLDCTPKYQNLLIETGMKIKYAIMDSVKKVHPLEPGMNFLFGAILLVNRKTPIIIAEMSVFLQMGKWIGVPQVPVLG
ncbi:MAG: hypothetical protein CM1200mP10_01500 [Candidatus Neomarinimicrobiota bacterium]|nr:MAG: hypothetical protein CM1200mP10_01500 [Candidatus Neomarinimicrobiota bacterium]